MTHNSGEILHFGFFEVQRFDPKIVEFSYTYRFKSLTDEELEIYEHSYNN